MIAPEKHRSRRAAPAETIPLVMVDDLTLGRVTAWPARRAHDLLAAPDWREQLAALLREDETFRTAVRIASAGLRPVVERVLRGETLDERAAAKLLAYAVRMATRTTPFGIFASVGTVAFGAHELRVDDVRARVAHANVDHEWLVGAVDALAERALAEGEDLVVTTATALRREGPRFALLDERKVFVTGEGTQYRSVTIAATPPVSHALDRARGGCSADALARSLADTFAVDREREHLDAFRKRFYDRYESGERLVPLLELVGPQGIGIPLKTEFDRAAPADAPAPARAFRLAALVGDALARGAREIALSGADWAAIRPDRPEVPPPSLEVGFTVLAPSFDAIAAGEYRIVSSPMTASYGAGKTTGRFAKYQPAAFVRKLREIVAAEAPRGALTAEPVFVPERARSGNVIAHPVVAEAVIPINTHGGEADAVALDDLLVGIPDDRVELWSRSRRRRVHVVWPHAFNALLAPPLARFFAFVARDGGRVPVPFDVGALGALPFVPRIRLGRVVLRRAAWAFPVAELRERGLAALAAERGIPRHALFGDGDNVIEIGRAS